MGEARPPPRMHEKINVCLAQNLQYNGVADWPSYQWLRQRA